MTACAPATAPPLPICAFGRSAGGHLALLLAARRPACGCVVAEAGIADLAALADQAMRPARPDPRPVVNWATAAFGADRLADVSAGAARACARACCTRSRRPTRSSRSRRRRRSPPRSAARDPARLRRHAAPAGPATSCSSTRLRLRRRPARSSTTASSSSSRRSTIGDVIAPASARVRVVRTRGLRVRFHLREPLQRVGAARADGAAHGAPPGRLARRRARHGATLVARQRHPDDPPERAAAKRRPGALAAPDQHRDGRRRASPADGSRHPAPRLARRSHRSRAGHIGRSTLDLESKNRVHGRMDTLRQIR